MQTLWIRAILPRPTPSFTAEKPGRTIKIPPRARRTRARGGGFYHERNTGKTHSRIQRREPDLSHERGRNACRKRSRILRAGGRIYGGHRAFGLRQDHRFIPRGGAFEALFGRNFRARQAGGRKRGQIRLYAAKRRTVLLAQHRKKHYPAFGDPKKEHRRKQGKGALSRKKIRARRFFALLPRPAFGRDAPARGAHTHPRARPRDPAFGRTFFRARLSDAAVRMQRRVRHHPRRKKDGASRHARYFGSHFPCGQDPCFKQTPRARRGRARDRL